MHAVISNVHRRLSAPSSAFDSSGAMDGDTMDWLNERGYPGFLIGEEEPADADMTWGSKGFKHMVRLPFLHTTHMHGCMHPHLHQHPFPPFSRHPPSHILCWRPGAGSGRNHATHRRSWLHCAVFGLGCHLEKGPDPLLPAGEHRLGVVGRWEGKEGVMLPGAGSCGRAL